MHLATLLTRFENNDQVIMAKLKRISDFFYSVLCAFVIRDFNMVPPWFLPQLLFSMLELNFWLYILAPWTVHEENSAGIRQHWIACFFRFHPDKQGKRKPKMCAFNFGEEDVFEGKSSRMFYFWLLPKSLFLLSFSSSPKVNPTFTQLDFNLKFH